MRFQDRFFTLNHNKTHMTPMMKTKIHPIPAHTNILYQRKLLNVRKCSDADTIATEDGLGYATLFTYFAAV